MVGGSEKAEEIKDALEKAAESTKGQEALKEINKGI